MQELPNSTHATTSKRRGDSLDKSSNQEKRTSKDPEETDLGVDLADLGLPAGNDEHIMLDATTAGRENAIIASTLGWSSCGRVEHLPGESLSDLSSRDLDPKLVYMREWNVGPVP